MPTMWLVAARPSQPVQQDGTPSLNSIAIYAKPPPSTPQPVQRSTPAAGADLQANRFRSVPPFVTLSFPTRTRPVPAGAANPCCVTVNRRAAI